MSLLARFGKDRSGSIGVMFALSLIPVLGLAGATVDYARASSARATLTAAIDSAALMAARDAPNLTNAQLSDRTKAWIRANLHGDMSDTLADVSVNIDRAGRSVSISASATIPAGMSQVFGEKNLTVSGEATSGWGTNTIELALVLDNTGSMASSGKMTALKQASLDLLKVMQDATTAQDQIRISIIPFATQVRMPTSYVDAPWLRFDLKNVRGKTQKERDEVITKKTWQGCIADRDQPFDATDAATVPDSKPTLYPADFCAQSSLAAIRPLTSNWTALANTINAMTPVGNTNVAIGAIWGLASLSQGAPLPEAAAAGTPRLTKYMIVLTDGDNTQNRFTSNQNDIDQRTAAACQSAKTAGVQVYTVRVIEGNRSLLRGCASKPEMYYEVNNAAQLGPIFRQIAGEISGIRLTM